MTNITLYSDLKGDNILVGHWGGGRGEGQTSYLSFL